jgi:hypothetical protein
MTPGTKDETWVSQHQSMLKTHWVLLQILWTKHLLYHMQPHKCIYSSFNISSFKTWICGQYSRKYQLYPLTKYDSMASICHHFTKSYNHIRIHSFFTDKKQHNYVQKTETNALSYADIIHIVLITQSSLGFV